MLFISYSFASLVTAFTFFYVLMKLGTYISPSTFDNNRDFMTSVFALVLIVIAAVWIFFDIPLWIILVPLIGFTILYPFLWKADARFRKIEKWELIVGIVFYLTGIASTIFVVVSLLINNL